MRISLWQQFSSNHSADFELVGTFETAEKAEDAANELRYMLTTIRDWYGQWFSQATKEEISAFWRSEELTPPEKEFKAKYDIAWSTHAEDRTTPLRLDWLNWAYDEPIGTIVKTYRNLVFLDNIGQTWCGPSPFDSIVAKLGGRVATGCEIDFTTTYVNFEGIAPDEIVARAVYENINLCLKYIEILSPPWAKVPFYPYFPPVENLISANPYQVVDPDRVLAAIDAIHNWNKTYSKIFSQVRDTFPREPNGNLIIDNERSKIMYEAAFQNENTQAAVNAILNLEGHGFEILVSREDLPRLLLKIEMRMHDHLSAIYRGYLERNGKALTLRVIHFGEMSTGLPNMVEYFESKGFDNISFEVLGRESMQST